MTERQLNLAFDALERDERRRRADFIEDVAVAVWVGDAAEARIVGHFGKATQQVEARLTEDGLRAGASGQQCATPPSP